MNCTKYRNWILLDQSGELDARDRARLARHMAGCEGCRNYREVLAGLRGRIRESAVIGPTDRVTMAVILDTAEHAARRRAAADESPARRRVLPWSAGTWAAAAAAILALGITLAVHHLRGLPSPAPVARGEVVDLAYIDPLDIELDLLGEEIAGVFADIEDAAIDPGMGGAEADYGTDDLM